MSKNNLFGLIQKETDNKGNFDINDIPLTILVEMEREKSDFDLTTIPEYERSFSVCWLAISYNPRRNLIHTPLHVFEIDKNLSFYLAYKRFFDEIPSDIEQIVATNHFESLINVDDQLLFKYVNQISYSIDTYDYLLNRGIIKYKQVPEVYLFDTLKSLTKFDHRFLIINQNIRFDEVPVYIRLDVYSDDFIINLIEHHSYKLTDFPYTFITDQILKHLFDTGMLNEKDVPKHLQSK